MRAIGSRAGRSNGDRTEKAHNSYQVGTEVYMVSGFDHTVVRCWEIKG